MTYLTPAPPRVLAHRGLALEAPENTMRAFIAALDAGATFLETDVHATADGVAVIAHDPSLDRVAGRDIVIEQTLWQDLAEIDLGQSEGVPGLREALLALPDARWNIDLKSDAAVVPAVRAVVEAKAASRVLLTSFSERRRRQALALLPEVATSASQPMVVRALAAQRLGLQRALARVLEPVEALQVPRRHRGIEILTERSIAAFRAAGVEVHAWTINDPAEMQELLAMGVDGIVTDRCDLARPLLP
ncbi:glycerophosphodiester phosphodiesterase [Agrococcus sediminis]|uniref:Glycerophosphodiester phosphodiesterase n=1 Tax=Agrococcus sediminis TaxID=2599924 RepID=A0A5M8QCC2_9MICO|nr:MULTISPECIES: glycerophosphodiester phosphodiesterase family protein [Agrococcus]KAA6433657.1 glycerophosphodiester phosphodiesterase [Agrococcus sediminis]MDR7234720.1 glycerophosphoryl diester phosphodiesterase [Agrococcus sp. BE272]RWR24320.1 glycerophosphodiester phosphodiesterase [Agrococcus lahaulensis]